jgi:hypothetical protein
LASGKHLPVLLVTCNRPELLKLTLASLLQGTACQTIDTGIPYACLVRGLLKEDIVVVQDGALETVATVVRDAGLFLKQNTGTHRPLSNSQTCLRCVCADSNALRRGASKDGASRIAQHYKFALSFIFENKPEVSNVAYTRHCQLQRSTDRAHVQAPAVIVIEDDLLFSPDFYEYFQVNAPVLEVLLRESVVQQN